MFIIRMFHVRYLFHLLIYCWQSDMFDYQGMCNDEGNQSFKNLETFIYIEHKIKKETKLLL